MREAEKRGQDIRGIEKKAAPFSFFSVRFRIPEQERHTDRFIVRPLFLHLPAGMEHVPVVRGEDQEGILLKGALFQAVEERPDAVIQGHYHPDYSQ